MEIERRFLVESVPHEPMDSVEVYQGYIFTSSGTMMRVRQIADRFWLTSKVGDGMCRDEQEIPINEMTFNFLKSHVKSEIYKVRNYIHHGDHVIELDVFRDGRIIAEVEFLTEEDARRYHPPLWFGREVTGIKMFSNASIAEGFMNDKICRDV